MYICYMFIDKQVNNTRFFINLAPLIHFKITTMKKFQLFVMLFAVIIIVMSTSGLHAQTFKNPKLGFRLAPNVGWMKPDAKLYENDGAVFGFSWGFVSEFPLAENYYLSSGFNIVFNNGKLKYPHKIDADGMLYRKYNLKYLELPIVMRLRAPDLSGYIFYAQLGFGASVLLDAKAEDKFLPDTGPAVLFEKDKISEDMNLLKASLIIGVGVEYQVGSSSKLMVGLLFNNGFTNVLKGNNKAQPGIEHAGKPNFIELNVGFLF